MYLLVNFLYAPKPRALRCVPGTHLG